MDLFGIRRFPFFTRSNFRNEIKYVFLWSVFAGMMQGQFASVVISKSFGAGDFLIAIATALPFAANIVSLAWGMLCIGRPKIRLAMMFASGAVLCTSIVGFVPNTYWGSIWFLAQIAAAQALLAGVVTARSAMWKSNYPVEVRGQIIARLQRIQSLMTVLAVQSAAAICDTNPNAYRFIFPVFAAFGAIGVLILPSIRIRRERSELRRFQSPVTNEGDSISGWFSLATVLSPASALTEMVRVFRDDHRFAAYCVAQTIHGVSNLLTIPVVVAIVTRHLHAGGRYGFWISSGLLVTLPALALLGSLPRWGKLFDALGVLRFRIVNVICWAFGLTFGLFGTLALVHDGGTVEPRLFIAAVILFSARAILFGFAQGGGKIAWNLGHLHFASPERAEVYMGIHVFLTGVRGLIAPLVGMWLWNLIGWPVWLIAIFMALTAMTFYALLARAERRDGDRATLPVE